MFSVAHSVRGELRAYFYVYETKEKIVRSTEETQTRLGRVKVLVLM